MKNYKAKLKEFLSSVWLKEKELSIIYKIEKDRELLLRSSDEDIKNYFNLIFRKYPLTGVTIEFKEFLKELGDSGRYICENCKSAVSSLDKFCVSCGSKFDEGENIPKDNEISEDGGVVDDSELNPDIIESLINIASKYSTKMSSLSKEKFGYKKINDFLLFIKKYMKDSDYKNYKYEVKGQYPNLFKNKDMKEYICENCKKETNDIDKFCTHCGNQFDTSFEWQSGENVKFIHPETGKTEYGVVIKTVLDGRSVRIRFKGKEVIVPVEDVGLSFSDSVNDVVEFNYVFYDKLKRFVESGLIVEIGGGKGSFFVGKGRDIPKLVKEHSDLEEELEPIKSNEYFAISEDKDLKIGLWEEVQKFIEGNCNYYKLKDIVKKW